MKSGSSSALKFTAILLTFSLLQLYTVMATGALLPQTLGRLTTRGNQPVQVNGNRVTSGATVMTGATISTGDGVGASINLGPLDRACAQHAGHR